MMKAALYPQRTNRSFLFEWWRSIDHVTLGLFAALLGVGLILSMAASPAASTRYGLDDPFYFLYRHGLFVIIGFMGAFCLSTFSPENARRIGVLTLVATFGLLGLVLIGGYEVKGATRWLRYGSFSLQPSEFVKPAFVVFAAWMFSVRKRDPNIPAIFIVFCVYLALIILLIQQPDFGQSFLLTLCFAAVFFFAGLSLGWMLFMMGVSSLGALGAYFALPHVRDRVARFMDPGGADTYQTDKALEAISQGGFLGRGPGEGAVKYSLPDGHTDFIFAVVAEEFGFLLSICLIGLLAAFIIRVYQNALRLNDYFCQLVVAGLATMIGIQVVINLFVNLNMAPAKGMTLPFISYGGSSLLSLCFAAGLILAFTRRRPGAYGYGI